MDRETRCISIVLRCNHRPPWRRAFGLSIGIPTFNEWENVEEIIQRIDVALVGTHWEIMFVYDDSPDGAAEIVRAASRRDPRVRCLHNRCEAIRSRPLRLPSELINKLPDVIGFRQMFDPECDDWLAFHVSKFSIGVDHTY